MANSVDETLAERGRNYGDFRENFAAVQEIKKALRKGAGWADMPAERREALEMIAVKMGRLVSGDSGHADSWHDIAGYARLVEQDLVKVSNASVTLAKMPGLIEEGRAAAAAMVDACVGGG